jgi:lysozyme
MDFVNGLDVSDFQGLIAWEDVRASGYSFAIAKATEGTGNYQVTLPGNLTGGRAAGLIMGAYHFLDWNEDPIAQANHFLANYTPRVGDLPPALDCESCTCDSAQAVSKVSAFIAEVEKHLSGRRMLIYFSLSFPSDHLQGGSGFSGHPTWVADYGVAEVPVPDAWTKTTIWQYSDTGKVGGIDGDVDLDRFVGTLDDLKAFVL